jgi:hypothetical protein
MSVVKKRRDVSGEEEEEKGWRSDWLTRAAACPTCSRNVTECLVHVFMFGYYLEL